MKISRKIISAVNIRQNLIVFAILFGAALLLGRETSLILTNISVSLVENRASEMKTIPEDVLRTTTFNDLDTVYHLPVLMYHYVEYVTDARDTIRKSLDTTPHIFESQIKTFKENGYEFLFMSEVVDILLGRRDIPLRAVAITFDDGYRDFYSDVMPILSKYGAKATVYVISGFLDKPNYLYIGQLREIMRSGLVEVGAHTVKHENLKGRNGDLVRHEVEASRKELEKITGRPVVSFAYPFGAFDSQAIRIVKESGYQTAVSTIEGTSQSISNRYFMSRVRPGVRTGQDLLNYLDTMGKVVFSGRSSQNF